MVSSQRVVCVRASEQVSVIMSKQIHKHYYFYENKNIEIELKFKMKREKNANK